MTQERKDKIKYFFIIFILLIITTLIVVNFHRKSTLSSIPSSLESIDFSINRNRVRNIQSQMKEFQKLKNVVGGKTLVEYLLCIAQIAIVEALFDLAGVTNLLGKGSYLISKAIINADGDISDPRVANVVKAVAIMPDETRNADFKHAEAELDEMLALLGL